MRSKFEPFKVGDSVRFRGRKGRITKQINEPSEAPRFYVEAGGHVWSLRAEDIARVKSRKSGPQALESTEPESEEGA